MLCPVSKLNQTTTCLTTVLAKYSMAVYKIYLHFEQIILSFLFTLYEKALLRSQPSAFQ